MQKLCPTCHQYLAEVDHLGVLVDICSQCKGIWLERGEMEKIIGYIRGTMTPPERTERGETLRGRTTYNEPYDEPPRRREWRDDDDDDRDDVRRRRRKRRFEWDDLLEIFGD